MSPAASIMKSSVAVMVSASIVSSSTTTPAFAVNTPVTAKVDGILEMAALVQAEPLEVKTLPEVLGVT